MKKHSAIFGIENLRNYDIGDLMTYGGLAVSFIGMTVALAGHALEKSSLGVYQLRFPDNEALDVVDWLVSKFAEE